MEAWTLGLDEGMRFWANSGLRHVLCDQDVSTFDVPRETHSVVPKPQRTVVPPSRPGWNEPKKRSVSAEQSYQQAKNSPDKSAVNEDAQRKAPGSAQQPSAPRFEQSDEALAVFPWEQFRPRLRVPSRCVWTYWDLGHDFGAHPDDARRELFKTILGHLRWAVGSVTFWPLNFEYGDGLKAQPGQFWRGVSESQANTVFCFGEQAFNALFPRRPFDLTPISRGNVSVQPLPGPTAMLGGDKEAKRIVWQTLKSHVFRS